MAEIMNRIVFAILFTTLLPIAMKLLFNLIAREKYGKNKEETDRNFVMRYKIFAALGIAGVVVISAVLITQALFQKEFPSIVFYVIFILINCGFAIMALKGLFFRVIVSGEKITAHDLFKKPFSFTFSEIASVERQFTGGHMNSEDMIIRTDTGKKLRVMDFQYSYNRLFERIRHEVPPERLKGFY